MRRHGAGHESLQKGETLRCTLEKRIDGIMNNRTTTVYRLLIKQTVEE